MYHPWPAKGTVEEHIDSDYQMHKITGIKANFLLWEKKKGEQEYTPEKQAVSTKEGKAGRK